MKWACFLTLLRVSMETASLLTLLRVSMEIACLLTLLRVSMETASLLTLLRVSMEIACLLTLLRVSMETASLLTLLRVSMEMSLERSTSVVVSIPCACVFSSRSWTRINFPTWWDRASMRDFWSSISILSRPISSCNNKMPHLFPCSHAASLSMMYLLPSLCDYCSIHLSVAAQQAYPWCTYFHLCVTIVPFIFL